MRWILVMAMVLLFSAGSEALADGGKKNEGNTNENASCASSALVCKSLDALDVESNQSVVHPCTTFDGDPGAWVCQNADKLSDPPNQPSLTPSRGENYRDMNGQ